MDWTRRVNPVTTCGASPCGQPPVLQAAVAVAGGGLTEIANAPNPAGVGILHDAKMFEGGGISPHGLFLGALLPTAVANVFFGLLY
jgi:hypothetical protein